MLTATGFGRGYEPPPKIVSLMAMPASSASMTPVSTTLAIPTPAFAWGAIGHEVICEIAFQELTPAARAKVEALIERDNEFNLFPSPVAGRTDLDGGPKSTMSISRVMPSASLAGRVPSRRSVWSRQSWRI
jgi:hypothetical protein